MIFMRLTDKNTEIKMLEHRIALMKVRGEQERSGIIAKAKRQIRKLQQEG
jgi:hypothetical protein